MAAHEGSGPKRVREAFIDTNILLRYLLDDIPEQADAVESLLKQALRGEIVLKTNAMVIAEIIWTCESYYNLPREEIRNKVLTILNTPGLVVADSDLLAEAVLIYADKNIVFIDAYNGCWMKDQGVATVYTFDEKHYKRLEEVEGKVPRED